MTTSVELLGLQWGHKLETSLKKLYSGETKVCVCMYMNNKYVLTKISTEECL